MMAGKDIHNNNIVDKLKHERDRFVAFAFASADILMELDKNGIVRYADGAIFQLLTKQPQELVGKAISDIIAEDDKDLVKYFLGPESKIRIDNVAVRLKTKIGSSYPLLMSGYKISELQGHYYLTFSTFRTGLNVADISRRDLETGLLRRGEFCLAVNRQLILSRFSERNPHMTLMNIKGLNMDSERDYTDNKVMPQICDILKGHSVNGDTAGLIEGSIIGFVHFENTKAEDVKNKILKALNQTSPRFKDVVIDYVSVKLSADLAISEEDSAQAIVFTINKFVEAEGEQVASATLSEFYEEMVGETVTKIAEFRQTVEDELFDLAFQPIVEIKTGAVSHFEVLTRLRDARNFSNPFQFIEFGENVGIISDFDFKMVCRSIDVLRSEKANGLNPSFAINVSGHSFSSKLFVDKLMLLLSKNSDICKQIIFEITESARLSNIKDTNEIFKKLREMGIRMSIDDFGTGEATFDYLRNLEVDIVKVDGSFIADDALSTDKGKHLLKAIADLCTNLNLEVIGEKVETADNALMLSECGVKYAQGYFYMKPSTDKAVLHTTEIVKSLDKVVKLDDFKK